MNYLVYRGLIHPKYQGIEEVQTARSRLAKASTQLLLGEWLRNGHVHENYNAATGEGNDVSNSNPFCASVRCMWGTFDPCHSESGIGRVCVYCRPLGSFDRPDWADGKRAVGSAARVIVYVRTTRESCCLGWLSADIEVANVSLLPSDILLLY
jgi:hypothetical protein|eukprot:COSAG02_NODE_1058_length_14905_cov_7.369882_8_plen_153_part_00